jgi:hypothetical protein
MKINIVKIYIYSVKVIINTFHFSGYHSGGPKMHGLIHEDDENDDCYTLLRVQMIVCLF